MPSLFSNNAGVSKSRSTVVRIRNGFFLYYYLFIFILFSIRTTVNLLAPTPVLLRELEGAGVDLVRT